MLADRVGALLPRLGSQPAEWRASIVPNEIKLPSKGVAIDAVCILSDGFEFQGNYPSQNSRRGGRPGMVSRVNLPIGCLEQSCDQ